MPILDIASFEGRLLPVMEDALLSFPFEASAEIKLNMALASLEDKRKKNPNVGLGSLRVITGNLARSFEKYDANNIYQITKINSAIQLIYGSSLPYARIHEFGGKAHRAIVPKRPYFYDGLNKWKIKFQKKLELKLKIAITDELQIWLEKQRQSPE